jgi:hypothetical protein
MAKAVITTRVGHPDFLDLDWSVSIGDWEGGRTVEVPTGIHRHVVRFVAYDDRIYAIKELPKRIAQHEYDCLRELETTIRPVAHPVGVIERPWVDPTEEWSAAVVTQYVSFAFSYRELIEGGGFGRHRERMLDAFAGLLVELHLAGCFWGDCSLSNVLYRWDAETIEAIMIDAETVELHEELTRGQRYHDLDIMEINVAGGMADLAASQGLEIDVADMGLGADVIRRYEALWDLLTTEIVIGPNERYKVNDHIARLNHLGFEVSDMEYRPATDGVSSVVRFSVEVGGRRYHSSRLRELTRLEASEYQARQILSDLRHYEAQQAATSVTGKSLAAIRWRVDVFEPTLMRLAADFPDQNPIQRYTDFLNHRYLMATEQQRDVSDDEAYEHWIEVGAPGFLPPKETAGSTA